MCKRAIIYVVHINSRQNRFSGEKSHFSFYYEKLAKSNLKHKITQRIAAEEME